MSSSPDYCNSILSVIADIDLTKLQHVQNWLRCDKVITMYLHWCVTYLQWLRVKFSINFIICLLTCDPLCANNLFIWGPCLPHHSHSVQWDPTRESPYRLLESRPTQAQGHIALVQDLWNNRPLSVCSATSSATFCKHLKTHLFDLAFSPWSRSCPMVSLFRYLRRFFPQVLSDPWSAVFWSITVDDYRLYRDSWFAFFPYWQAPLNSLILRNNPSLTILYIGDINFI